VNIAEAIDVRGLLRTSPGFGDEEIGLLSEALSGQQVAEAREEIESLAAESGDSESLTIRAGIGLYLLGQHARAHDLLADAGVDPLAIFVDAKVLMALGRFDDASERFDQAASSGYDRTACLLLGIGAVRASGNLDKAEELLRNVPADSTTTSEYSFQMGCVLADQCNTDAAVESFERAIDYDAEHSRALFHLALENSRQGNDEEAIRLYEQSLSKPPQYLGALLNLGLLYEDDENYPAAAYCFRRILSTNPHHSQAQLYLKDIEATSDMYYDEDSAKAETRMQQLLSRPVTDFELTVRSRNCLESINVETLGDLTQVTEIELLEGKNFGETSLIEIRDLMQLHSLKIGQNINKDYEPELPLVQSDISPEERALIEKPVSDLNLSVRARKCMARLGINQIGELVRRTPDELLSSKNFGVTSLNEIRAKLSELGMKLRND